MPRFEHLFFDLDGTLTDPAPGIVGCYQHVIAKLGLRPRSDAELHRFIGPPLREALGELLGNYDPESVERAVGLYRERFATQGLYENAVYPGVQELLSELGARGYRLWIATSKAGVYAAEIARHFGFAGHFSGIHGAELSGERSNKAELIAYMLERNAIAASATLMIGDRSHDVHGARAHGLFAIGVLWGYGSRTELEAAGAHALAESVPMILDCVARLELSDTADHRR